MILTCVVTHDRLAYSQRCIESLLATRRAGDRIVVVDNASTDGTVEWLATLDLPVIFNPTNRFPGAACNQGWDTWAGEELLHRSDNDIEYLPGWQDEVEFAFAEHPNLALLGILNLHEDRHCEPTGHGADPIAAVGGNVVMPARLFRSGLRWSEEPWGLACTEDGPMSAAALQHGEVLRLIPTVANNMAFCRYEDFPDYYNITGPLRGYRAETCV